MEEKMTKRMSHSWLIKSSAVGVASAIAGGMVIGQAVAAADVEPLEMRITNSYLEDMAPGVALEHFAERVEELSDGNMTVDVFHGGSLYSEGASVEAVLDGTIEMGLASTSNHGPFTDVWSPMEAPYLFEGREEFREVIIRGEVGDEMREATKEDGLYPLMILETGGFRVLGTQEEVRVPADLDGKRIRVPGSAVPQTFWNTAGASAANVAWSETYVALGQGAVDGLDAAWTSWYLGSLWDVTESITPVHYSVVASLTPVRLEWWEERTPKQREILKTAAHEAEQLSMEEEDRWDEKLREMVNENGVTIVDLTDEEMDEWRDVGRGIWDDIYDDASLEQVERIEAAVQELEE